MYVLYFIYRCVFVLVIKICLYICLILLKLMCKFGGYWIMVDIIVEF